MNKQNKLYESPLLFLIELSQCDVITASDGGEVKSYGNTWKEGDDPWGNGN